MRLSNNNQGLGRHGGIAPLTCILLVAILGMVAFAVDISWMVLTESELQNTADAAALAGANKLADNFVLYALPTQSTANKDTLRAAAVAAAKTTAQTYAGYHQAGGVTLTLPIGDIDVGYTDAAGVYTSYSADSSNYPNTVKVTTRRDNSANTPLSMFFAPVLGVSQMNMSAKATATLYSGAVNGFKIGSVNSAILPVTFDVNDWNNFLATGKDGDGVIRTDAGGNPQLQVYGTIKQEDVPGNFGLLSLNNSLNGTSTIADWIHNGVPPSDMQILRDNNLLPLSLHTPGEQDWQSNTGFRSANAMDVNQNVGKTYLLPLFKPVSTTPYVPAGGQGANAAYEIVQFVAVKVMPTNQTNKEVLIQPAVYSDPNAVLTNITPANPANFATAFTTKLTN